jgi:hypothetical protein
MNHRYRSWVLFLSSLPIAAMGCRPAAFVAGAVVRQGASSYGSLGRAGRWCFDGLDPGVPPRIRPGTYATATHGVPFLDPTAIGPHSYRFSWAERNGIVYTCRGGHIDIAHVRKAADCTGYLAGLTLERLRKGETRFQCRLIEPSLYWVELTPPPEWDRLADAERERIARDVSREFAQYVAFTALTWHEFLTWFGYQPRPHKSEFPSAFSWEDTYSNLLGVHIAGIVLENGGCFSEALTVILDQWLQELGGLPARVGREATMRMDGTWYTRGWLTTKVWERNFDLGLDDGHVTPTLIPAVPGCGGAEPLPLTVPTLDSLARYGFSAKVEIEGRVWEMKKIRKALATEGCPNVERLDPVAHYPLLIEYLRRDSEKMLRGRR